MIDPLDKDESLIEEDLTISYHYGHERGYAKGYQDGLKEGYKEGLAENKGKKD